MCEAREQRGLLIAAMYRITKKGQTWKVPSQTEQGKTYTVIADEQSPFCSCPDFERRGECCKHVFAVRYVIKRETTSDGDEMITEALTISKTQKRTYPQKWAEYNQAQTHEKDHFQVILKNLCDQIQEPPAKPRRGRPRVPMSDCVFMSCFKVYSTVSQRRFMCDLDDAKDHGYIQRTPHFNAISDALESQAMTPHLKKLITISSLPLRGIETDFAIDASGFSGSKFVRWFEYKHQNVREVRDWVKAHIVCGVKTHIVTAATVTHKDANDCPFLPELVNATAENFDIRELSADAQYASQVNFDVANTIGADAFIDFRSNITGGCGGMFAKAFHFFRMYQEEFWQSYHKRSNVESVFSMVKRTLGDSVRSKTQTAMENEVLCKFVCHNIRCLISAMYELGVDPKCLSC